MGPAGMHGRLGRLDFRRSWGGRFLRGGRLRDYVPGLAAVRALIVLGHGVERRRLVVLVSLGQG